MARECIEKYLAEHTSKYIGKYRCHSSVQTKKFEHKFRYYILDSQFRDINVFLTIDYSGEEIIPTFSVELHEQEQEYIIKDALNKIIYDSHYKTILHCHIIAHFIETHQKETLLEPLDYRNILDYLEYHNGTNQETVDQFYSFLMPYLNRLIYNKNYKKFMDSITLLLDKILYEYEWDGTTAKYLDTQYQYHLYYFREIIRIVYANLDKFYKETKEQLLEAIWRLCKLQRFAFTIMTDFGSLVLSHYHITLDIFHYINKRAKDEHYQSIVLPYMEAIFNSDDEAFKDACKDVIRFVMNDMLTFANHDLQIAIGNSIVLDVGYQLLIDLFSQDYNTFVFVCFPISTFPEEYRCTIKKELEKAIRFYAARMEHDEYRLTSFEQVANINRLLMENYREDYRSE